MKGSIHIICNTLFNRKLALSTNSLLLSVEASFIPFNANRLYKFAAYPQMLGAVSLL